MFTNVLDFPLLMPYNRSINKSWYKTATLTLREKRDTNARNQGRRPLRDQD
jgi:hypothetical protein